MTKSTFITAQIAVIGLALIVRLINLNGSFWLDEAAQVLESSRPFSQQLNISGDFQPPLFHYLVHFWLMGGTSEWWLRLASLIPGLITIWVTVRLGKKLYSPSVGITAGVLLATSQFHAFYSQELRPYSLAAMWAVIMVSAYYDLLRRQKGAAVVFVCAGIAGLYTMYVFPLLFIALLVVTALWHKDSLKRLIVLYCFIGVAFLPWLPSFLKQLGIGTGLTVTAPAWKQMVSPPLAKMLPLVVTKFILGRITVDFTVKDIMLIGTLCLLAAWLIKRANRYPLTKEVIVWLVVPIIAAWLISIKVPILDPKRVIFCLPALYLLLAAGLDQRAPSAFALMIFLSVNMTGLSRYASDPLQQREPWKQAIATVEAASQPNDRVIFPFIDSAAPWQWYQRKNLEIISGTDLENHTNSAPHIFVFDYLRELADPQSTIPQTLTRLGYIEINTWQYPSIGKIHQFSIK